MVKKRKGEIFFQNFMISSNNGGELVFQKRLKKIVASVFKATNVSTETETVNMLLIILGIRVAKLNYRVANGNSICPKE